MGFSGIFLSLLVLLLPNKISKELLLVGLISVLVIYLIEFNKLHKF